MASSSDFTVLVPWNPIEFSESGKCYSTLPGFFPGVVILLHHMTVGAGLRIVGEVGVAFGVDEGIKTESSREPDQNAQHDDRKRLQSILPPLEQDVQ